jgi:hypothetical protein
MFLEVDVILAKCCIDYRLLKRKRSLQNRFRFPLIMISYLLTLNFLEITVHLKCLMKQILKLIQCNIQYLQHKIHVVDAKTSFHRSEK